MLIAGCVGRGDHNGDVPHRVMGVGPRIAACRDEGMVADRLGDLEAFGCPCRRGVGEV
jgi:hypothetical protein